jgi:alpha-galactosidase
MQILGFPESLGAIVTRKLSAARLILEAALTGDRRLFVEALLADGALSDPQVAAKMADELLRAHRECLPSFS